MTVDAMDLTGHRYGEWEVLSFHHKVLASYGRKHYKYYWTCRCSCGTIKEVISENLRNGKSKSCGHAKYVEADRNRYMKHFRLLTQYGITLRDYEDMYEEQGGRCYICYKPQDTLVVDHDHETGRVRRLLCTQCNTLLGMAGDDEEILSRAIEYLREHDA